MSSDKSTIPKRGRGRPRKNAPVASQSPAPGASPPLASDSLPSQSRPSTPQVHWSNSEVQRASTPQEADSLLPGGGIAARQRPSSTVTSYSTTSNQYASPPSSNAPILDTTGLLSLDTTEDAAVPSTSTATPSLSTTQIPSMPFSATAASANYYNRTSSMPPPTSIPLRPQAVAKEDEDGEGDDEFFPAMADDDYSAQQTWNSQSKDNLKSVSAFEHDCIVNAYF